MGQGKNLGKNNQNKEISTKGANRKKTTGGGKTTPERRIECLRFKKRDTEAVGRDYNFDDVVF